ncbi:DUF4037 domain-containing protein [Longispora albida]|uniref:DUF4037 domain-containing protein n=1 Tax=Longispora albida TaxID=203523 RepID=UPI00037A54DA|nr:DUF4037 domain-containing protein [Longispora albida]
MMAARHEIAKQYATWYSELGASAVLLGGSTGRGHADRWSDVELGVFWPADPPPARTEVPGHVRDHGREDDAWHDDLRAGSPGPALPQPDHPEPDHRGWGLPNPGLPSPGLLGCGLPEPGLLGPGLPEPGLLVEVVHLPLSAAHVRLDRLFSPTPDPDLLTFAAALTQGRLLAGDLSALTTRVATYPDALAAAVVRSLGQIDHFWRWRMYLERDDPHGLRAHFASVARAVIHMLCGLNRRYWPGPKWPNRTLAGLTITPHRAADRLNRAATARPAEAAALLSELVTETHGLIAVHLPAADPARLHEIFTFTREPWP